MISDKVSLGFDDVLILPKLGQLRSRADADLSTFLTCAIEIQIPIISSNMPSVTGPEMAANMAMIGGYGFLHRFCTVTENVKMFREAVKIAQCPPVWIGCSLGVNEKFERIEALLQEGAEVFLVDVAHAYTVSVHNFVGRLRDAFPDIQLIVGNIATAKAAMEYDDICDALKVGIGNGAACSTRTVTGAGRGQFTALQECAEVTHLPIISDGGCKNSGDIVKALAAGARTVMLGRLLAGAEESPHPGLYWGNASRRVNGHKAPEGIEGVVPQTGTLEDTIKPLLWGIRSGISYAGSKGVKGLYHSTEFERVAPGVNIETATRI